MTNLPQEEFTELESQAMLIAGEIFNLINQYTNDSNISKFFLTDEVARACYGLAGGFSAVIYIPDLTPEEVKDTQILSFIYALMTYGFNIYLKERTFITHGSPYTLPADLKILKNAQKKTLTLTSNGKLVSTPLADKIIMIILENVTKQINMRTFVIKKHRLNRTKFLDYTKLSLYWGYNFARELLTEKKSSKAKKRK
jgi:hypothetical protein